MSDVSCCWGAPPAVVLHNVHCSLVVTIQVAAWCHAACSLVQYWQEATWQTSGGRWSAEANQEAGGGGGGWGGANVKITQVPLPPSISQQLAWSWSVHTVDSTKNVKIGVEWRHVIYLCCLLSSCVCLDWYLASHLIRSNPCPQIHFRWSAKC